MSDPVRIAGVCISILPGGQMPTQSEGGSGSNPSGSSRLVPDSVGAIGRLSSPSTQVSRPPQGPLRPNSSHDGHRIAAASRMEAVRGRFLAGGISEKATQLITAAWSRGTNTAYQSA